MADLSPENRRYPDPPFTPMSAGVTAPLRAEGYCDDDPSPSTAGSDYEQSGTGTWAGSRPDRARANNARYGATSQSETATPAISGPDGGGAPPMGDPSPSSGAYAPTPCG